MLIRSLSAATLLWLGLAASAWAQFKEGRRAQGAEVGADADHAMAGGNRRQGVGRRLPRHDRLRPGAHRLARTGSQRPEGREIGGAQISYETVDGGVKIMRVRIGHLPAGQEAKALVTVEVRRHAILPPDDTDIYQLPDVKKLPTPIRLYLTPSPKIESRDPKIRELAKEIGVDKDKAWDHVAAIYDWVRSHVKYKNGPLKGALAALRDGTGDCEEYSSLFIAICRAADIPARTVWVPGHCYSEFYLVTTRARATGSRVNRPAREFGGISELRPILQKGDNFRPPASKGSRERQRYMAESLVGSPMPGGGKPQVNFIGHQVAK